MRTRKPSSKSTPKRAMKFQPASSILFSVLLGLATAMLAGCVGLASGPKTASTPTPQAPAALQLAPITLNTGSVEASYSAALTATGGFPPYKWKTIAGELPPGLQLNAQTGSIAGTPILAGSYSFTAEVQDTKAAAAAAILPLSISASPAPTVSAVLPNSGPTSGGMAVTISGSNFRSGSGVQFGNVAATSVVLVSSTQIQAVVPAEPVGSVPVTVWNSGSAESTEPNAFSFVAPELQIVTTLFPVGEVGASYSSSLSATGGTPGYTWSAAKGALPSGLQLNAATGAIAGMPTQSGSFSFTAEAQDTKKVSASVGFTLVISPDPAPTITSLSRSSGASTGGTAVTISGGNFRTGATVKFGGIAPASTQLVSATQIQVVTPAEAAGTVNITVEDSDGQLATASNAFTFVGQPAPANATWNPSVLGVPWASDFNAIAANEINVKTDARLTVKAMGDGVTDDTAPIKAAIQLASSSGGGTVYFPAGDYKILTHSGATKGSPLVIPSRVILLGTGSTSSRIFANDSSAASWTGGNWTWGGIDFLGASLSGMSDLGVYAVNSPTSPCALLWNVGSTNVKELFFNNLDIHLGNCRTFWIGSTNDLLVQNSHIDSSISLNAADASQAGPVYISGNSNVWFLQNTVTYHFGRVQMLSNSNLLVQGNTIIRDAQNLDMQNGTAVESGGVQISLSQNIQLIDNTIETLNAPTNETDDGEAIMSQQSNILDVLDAGSATAITPTTVTDTGALWGSATASRLAQYPEVIAVLTGSATGQWRSIQGINTNTKTLTVSQPWSPVPEVGSLYSIFVWTLMNATIQGNTLIGNPNGIVLYDGCYGCTVQGNTLTNSRGIMLRVADIALNPITYPEGRRQHHVAIDNKILNNTVADTSGFRPAYIALDTEAFFPTNYQGMGMFNVQVGSNVIQPYSANSSQIFSASEISQEGFFPCFLYGPAAVKAPLTTVFQEINFWSNSQSTPVSYVRGFSSYTTPACVTASAPAQ